MYENCPEETLTELENCKDKLEIIEEERNNFEKALSELGDYLEAQISEPVLWLAYQTICDEHKAWPTNKKPVETTMTYKDLYDIEYRKNATLMELLDIIQSDIRTAISECEGIDHGNR